MSIQFNDQLLLWGLGVLQPAAPQEVLSFLKLVYPTVEQWPDELYLNDCFSHWETSNYIVVLNKKYSMYSLTALANMRMDVKLRRQRDKARISLLRAAYDASLGLPGAMDQDLGGASPSSEISSTLQEGSRPVGSGSQPSRSEPTRLRTRTYWSRVSEQLSTQVGLDFHSPGIPSFQYRYCSFPTLKALHLASMGESSEKDMSISELGLAIGVSPRLLTSFIHKPENHYRHFNLPKKGGGERDIAAPRFFLKTIQYWIKSYILCHLKVHDSCHAYMGGRSIKTNAEKHIGKAYVANVDIENFFGNITKEHVFRVLEENGVGRNLATAVSGIVTLNRVIPQGAPTSPVISNAVLYKFDEAMSKISGANGLDYSRYADDITFSADSRAAIESIVSKCRELLAGEGFNLKDEKTRVASNRASQRVTGLVVNEKVQPPREYRRRIRAIFNNALRNPQEYVDRLDELYGYFGYLSSFSCGRNAKQIRKDRIALYRVRRLVRLQKSKDE